MDDRIIFELVGDSKTLALTNEGFHRGFRIDIAYNIQTIRHGFRSITVFLMHDSKHGKDDIYLWRMVMVSDTGITTIASRCMEPELETILNQVVNQAMSGERNMLESSDSSYWFDRARELADARRLAQV